MVVDDSSSAGSTDDQDIEEDPFRANDSYTTIEFSDLPIEVKLYLHGEMPNYTTSGNYIHFVPYKDCKGFKLYRIPGSG